MYGFWYDEDSMKVLAGNSQGISSIYAEVDESKVPSGDIRDYDFIEGEFSYNAISATKREIKELKYNLSSTDYLTAKLCDELIYCSNMGDLNKLFKKFQDKYGEVIAQRQAWRDRINELEN